MSISTSGQSVSSRRSRRGGILLDSSGPPPAGSCCWTPSRRHGSSPPTTTPSAARLSWRADGLDGALIALSSPLGIEALPAGEAEPLLDAYHEGVQALGAPFGWWGARRARPAAAGRGRRGCSPRARPASRSPRAPSRAARGLDRVGPLLERVEPTARRCSCIPARRRGGRWRGRATRRARLVAGAHRLRHADARGVARVDGVGPRRTTRCSRSSGRCSPAARRCTPSGSRRAAGRERTDLLLVLRHLLLRRSARSTRWPRAVGRRPARLRLGPAGRRPARAAAGAARRALPGERDLRARRRRWRHERGRELRGAASPSSMARPGDWAHLVAHDPERRHYELLLRDDARRGLADLLDGRPRHGLPRPRPLRRRGRRGRRRGARGPAGARRRHREPRRSAAGETFTFAASDIHRVLHAGAAPAVTIHAYSPPLWRMGAYEVARHGRAAPPLRVLRRGAAPAPLAPSVVTTAS